jgi:glyoxylase-like metal-dependent hydrolase (beta-lactamase superfamily II)
MFEIKEVTAFPGGECKLIVSENETFAVDTGFTFGGERTLENVKSGLCGRSLDYVLVTHAHYDHAGAVPAFKKAFPDAKLVECVATNDILKRPGARKFIQEMNENAARRVNVDATGGDYDFPEADIVVKEGDEIHTKDATIVVFETPGHTRDSVMYYFKEEKCLVANETSGVMMEDGRVHASFVTSYLQTLDSIDRMQALGAKTLVLPHGKVLLGESVSDYFEKGRESAKQKAEMIVQGYDAGKSEDEILDEIKQKLFFTRSAYDLSLQPEKAFEVNQRAVVPRVLAELRGVVL